MIGEQQRDQAEKWFKQESTGRYYFEGKEVTDSKICDMYLEKFFDKKGAQNSVRYIFKPS